MTIRKRGWNVPNKLHWPWVMGRRATALAASLRATNILADTKPQSEEGNRHARRAYNSTPAKRYRQELARLDIARQVREAKANGMIAMRVS